MKKIVMIEDLQSVLGGEKTSLDRTGVRMLPAKSNDDVLAIHRAEKADLIITRSDAPGMSCEQVCSCIREENDLRKVSVIVICPDTPEGKERAGKCGANQVLFEPVDAQILAEKAIQLLAVPCRKSFRALLSVKVETSGEDRSFLCRSEDISSSGMQIETDKRLARGEIVTCSFVLPGSCPIHVVGEVIREVRPSLDSDVIRYGIKFMMINDHAKKAIDSFAGKRKRPRK